MEHTIISYVRQKTTHSNDFQVIMLSIYSILTEAPWLYRHMADPD